MLLAVIVLAIAVPVTGVGCYLLGVRAGYWLGYDARDAHVTRWPRPAAASRKEETP